MKFDHNITSFCNLLCMCKCIQVMGKSSVISALFSDSIDHFQVVLVLPLVIYYHFLLPESIREQRHLLYVNSTLDSLRQALIPMCIRNI